MITKTNFLDHCLGKGVVDALIKTMYNQVSDFPECHETYINAMAKLKELLGDEAKRDIAKYETAIEMKCSALMFYAGMLGLQMNYDHFRNPMNPTPVWREVDFDDFLRMEIIYNMPQYRAASRYMENFPHQIPEEVQSAIRSYETDLEICGLKLAHFYGYLLGNSLLQHCVSGYVQDFSLTFRYRHLLEQYFGCPLDMSQWDGIIQTSKWKIAPLPEFDPQEVMILREAIMKNT